MAESGSQESDMQIILDELDKQVLEFRRKASALQEERLQLVKTLDTLSQSYNIPDLNPCEQEEISAHVNRLMYRCLTVDISVETPRSKEQEIAFNQVTEYMKKVKETLEKDVEEGKLKVTELLNACACDEVKEGAVDTKFQSCLLGCTLEDQKHMKKTLQNWKENLSKSPPS